MNTLYREETAINIGFEQWWGSGKNRDGQFDKHISLCAFHAGARWQQGKVEATDYIPEILRHQAEIHCRCLNFLVARDTAKAIFKSGDKNSPPYWEAASLFIKDNSADPLRTEIVWLRSQFEWIGNQE